jgi:uncharacterized protein YwgA
MTTSKEMIVIAGVVNRLRKLGSWAGETHVQKTIYIAKSVFGLPLDAEFILYKHGPYSFDLNKNISHMLSRGILVSTPQGGYGPSLDVNEAMLAALDAASGGYLRTVKSQFEPACKQLAKMKVAELERVATAVYIHLNYPNLSQMARHAKLSELKPHIDRDTAVLAFEEAKPFLN